MLLYSAAPIRERICERCGSELPEPETGSPPMHDGKTVAEGARVGADIELDFPRRSPFRERRGEHD